MRKLGLIGGMSWFSTRSYYEAINRGVQRLEGPYASAPLLIESLDFTDLVRLSSDDDWARAAKVIGDSAARLERAGATALVIGANAMHRVYDEVAERVAIPVIHIAATVADRIAAAGIRRVALIGSRNVMLEGFYREKLAERGIELLSPQMKVVETLDRIIYDELIAGKIGRQSQRELKTIITNLSQDGAQAVVLGATELEMIVGVDANVLPIYDCTRIHAAAAVEWIMGGRGEAQTLAA